MSEVISEMLDVEILIERDVGTLSEIAYFIKQQLVLIKAFRHESDKSRNVDLLP